MRTRFSLISPGTEQSIASTAAKSLVGKARDRPDQARRVIDKALADGIRPAWDAVSARLDDVMTPGYSSMGVVEEVGSEVAGIGVGERVGCVGANAACHAERVVVPGPLCFPLPEELDDRWGAFGALGAIAAHGVRIAGVTAGSVVVVVGLGLVGQLAAQLATAAGARVIGVDLARSRVDLARELGAVDGIASIGDSEVDALVRSHTEGYGADAVIVTAATKDSAPVVLAAAVARDRATVSVVGDVGLDIPRAPFFEKELELRVSRSYGPGRYDDAYELEGRDYPIGYVRWTERRLIAYFFEEVAAGRIRLDELVTHEFPIERGEEAYGALSDASRLAIILGYPETEASPRPRVPVASSAPSATAGRPAARSSGRLRVAVIGPGLFARATLLPQLGRLGVDVAAVVGPSAARAFGVARRWGARYVASHPDEVLDDESIDVVVIATRHDSHAALATKALERGKGVFLEKPLAINAGELDGLEALLAQGGRIVVDFNRIFAPTARRALEPFAERTDPVFVGYRVNAGALPSDHWLRDRRQGGGRLVGEGCHFVDFCSAAVDRPLESVATVGLGASPSTLEGDNFTLTLRYADGSLATVAYVSSGGQRMPKERVELLGGGRSTVLDDFRHSDAYVGRRRERGRRLAGQDKGHGSTLEAAMRFFADGGEPPIPYRRLFETTRATLLARDALSAGDSAPRALPGRLAP